MEVTLSCRGCAHAWTITAEPRLLLDLACPACGQRAEAVAAEDLSSALEDALSQLWRLGQRIGIRIVLDSGALPPAFDGAPPPPSSPPPARGPI